ncbi:MAG: hypothetical protein Fur005_32990 [Roseiflexaceae bacterium]
MAESSAKITDPHPLQTWLGRARRVLSTELLVLYLAICCADIVVGMILPIFPTLAKDLGASLSFIGILTALSGAAQVISGVPIGMALPR